MDGRTTLIGGLAVVPAFGLLLAQQRSGSDEAALERQVDALNTRIGALEASLAVATARTNAQAEVIAETAALGGRLAETVQGLGTVAGAAGDAAAETAAAAPGGGCARGPGRHHDRSARGRHRRGPDGDPRRRRDPRLRLAGR